jgi:redox-sensitive bicupin YhaK (pirin superfamily)
MKAAPSPDDTRSVTLRTRGHGHGPITRLMSPSDFGQLLKPFIFLDLFSMRAEQMGSMPIHPHSGIATVTVVTEGNVRFEDVDSGIGMIGYGGVEWMRAAGGVWHGQEMSAGTSPAIRGFQLWVALPPELENGPVDSQYIEADRIPGIGPAKVIVGSYDGAHSPVRSPDGLTYLLVTLKPGESWCFVPSAGQDVAFLAVSRGTVVMPDVVEEGELAAITPGEGALTITARGDVPAVFVLGAARAHDHDLHMGSYSVHTSASALAQGEQRIAELGYALRQAGDRRQTSGASPVFR